VFLAEKANRSNNARVGSAGEQASRIAVYMATRLSALILLTGVAWSVGGYFLAEDPSAGLADAISYGVVVLATTWLAVFVVFVAVKAFRVVGAL
jgi:apolipoprotein N-acyltransferase